MGNTLVIYKSRTKINKLYMLFTVLNNETKYDLVYKSSYKYDHDDVEL